VPVFCFLLSVGLWKKEGATYFLLLKERWSTKINNFFMITKQTKFIIAIVIQLVIIFTIIIFKIAVLRSGTEVLLRIKPVDPRDPLRGDHLTFPMRFLIFLPIFLIIFQSKTVILYMYHLNNKVNIG
jgi:hypothetical protein